MFTALSLAASLVLAAAPHPPAVTSLPDGPRTVAVVAVYGSEKVSLGFNKYMSFAPWLDFTQDQIVTALSLKGFKVLPLAATAAEVTKAWDEAYYAALEPAQQQDLTSTGQPYLDLFSGKRRANRMIHSSLTTLVKDYTRLDIKGTDLSRDFENVHYMGEDPSKGTNQSSAVLGTAVQLDSAFTNTLAFRRALGKLVAAAGADAYVLVRSLPGTISYDDPNVDYWVVDPVSKTKKYQSGVRVVSRMDVVMVSTSGEQIYKKRLTGVSEDAIPRMQIIKMRYDSATVVERLEDAIQTSVGQLFASLDAVGPAVESSEVAFAYAPATEEQLAVLGSTNAGFRGSVNAKPVTAAEIAGRWELQEVNGQPLPFNMENGTVIAGAVHDLAADGTFKSVYTYMQEKGGDKEGKMDGKFEVSSNVVELKPKGFIVKLLVAIVGNPPLEFEADGATAKSIYNGATYTWKRAQ